KRNRRFAKARLDVGRGNAASRQLRAPRTERTGRDGEVGHRDLACALFASLHAVARVRKRRPDAAGRAALIAVVEVVDEMVVEVDRLLDEPETERAETKVEVGLRLVDGGRYVMKTQNRHRTWIIQPRGWPPSTPPSARRSETAPRAERARP